MTESLVARGRVVAVHPNDVVTVECATACPGCRCGRYFSDSTHHIEVCLRGSGLCSIGRTLAVAVPAVEVLRGSLWLYGLPWLALLVGTLLGTWLGRSDPAALIGAVAGLVAGVAMLKLLARRMNVPHLEVRSDE